MNKVLMILPRYIPIIGGAEVQCRRLINELKKNKDINVVGVVTRRIDSTLSRNAKVDEVDVTRLPPAGTSILSEYVFCLFLSLYLIINKNRYDVIHCHASSIFGITCSLVGSILHKNVFVKVSTNGEVKAMQNTKLKKMLTQYSSHRCTYIALNEEGYDEVKSNIKNARVKLIPNGIDFTNDHSLDAEEGRLFRNELHKKYGEDILIGVFVGRFVERKGINELCQAAAAFNNKKKIVFVLVGDAALQRDAISVNNIPSDNIIAVGRQENVFPFLFAADIFISPSHQEGLPNTVIEALSVGKKCLLSDIWPHRELWEEHSDNILLFHTGCVASIINQLDLVFDTIKNKASKNENNILLSKYSISNVAKEYAQLYKDKVNAVR